MGTSEEHCEVELADPAAEIHADFGPPEVVDDLGKGGVAFNGREGRASEFADTRGFCLEFEHVQESQNTVRVPVSAVVFCVDGEHL